MEIVFIILFVLSHDALLFMYFCFYCLLFLLYWIVFRVQIKDY